MMRKALARVCGSMLSTRSPNLARSMNLNPVFPVIRRKFPDPPIEFPDNVSKFPVRLSREFRRKPQRRQGFFGRNSAPRWPKSRKFPVFSLMIREFDAESGSRQTASSATQSGMFPYIVEAMKSARVARFTRSRGPGECERPRLRAKSLKILCSRFRQVHLRPGRHLAGTRYVLSSGRLDASNSARLSLSNVQSLLLPTPERGQFDSLGHCEGGEVRRLAPFGDRLDDLGCQKCQPHHAPHVTAGKMLSLGDLADRPHLA